MSPRIPDIGISAADCIVCRRCVKVCPAQIFVQDAPQQPIRICHPERCIGCGHCVDACPHHAVIHGEFPPERIHPIDYSAMPSPDELMLLLKARRSNRALTSRPVPREAVRQILEAALCAPTATNSQSVSFTVIDDPALLRKVADHTVGVFSATARMLEFPPVKWLLKPLRPDYYRYVPIFKSMKRRHEAGEDPILLHATTLIFIHTPQGYRFGAEDCNLAYQNGSLMAQALGISQIYMGFILTVLRRNPKPIARMLGIGGRIHAVMALGIPEFRYPNYADRKPLP